MNRLRGLYASTLGHEKAVLFGTVTGIITWNTNWASIKLGLIEDHEFVAV